MAQASLGEHRSKYQSDTFVLAAAAWASGTDTDVLSTENILYAAKLIRSLGAWRWILYILDTMQGCASRSRTGPLHKNAEPFCHAFKGVRQLHPSFARKEPP